MGSTLYSGKKRLHLFVCLFLLLFISYTHNFVLKMTIGHIETCNLMEKVKWQGRPPYHWHRLTYSHSWGLPHECNTNTCKCIRFFFWKTNYFFFPSEWMGAASMLPVRDAYTLASLYILFSTKKLGFRLKPLIKSKS